MAEYFVVIAGLPKQPDSEVVLVAATSPRQAHGAAAAEFRRKRDIASNVHVLTSTAHRSDQEGEATLFMARLMARVVNAAAPTGGSDA